MDDIREVKFEDLRIPPGGAFKAGRRSQNPLFFYLEGSGWKRVLFLDTLPELPQITLEAADHVFTMPLPAPLDTYRFAWHYPFQKAKRAAEAEWRKLMLANTFYVEGDMLIVDDGYEQQGLYVRQEDGDLIPLSELLLQRLRTEIGPRHGLADKHVEEIIWSTLRLGHVRLTLTFEEITEESDGEVAG